MTRLQCAAVSLFFFAVLAPLLSLAAIGGSSEAREVHVARVIYETGEWVLPLRNGYVPSKPPLFHWLTALLGIAAGGVNEVIARLVSLAAAGFMLFVTIRAGLHAAQYAIPARNFSRERVVYFTALMLMTSYGFLRLSSDARVDMLFAAFTTAGLALIFKACAEYSAGASSLDDAFLEGRLTLFFLACGLAVLAKGPLGIVLPGLIGFFMVWSVSDFKRSVRIFWRARVGWLVFFLTAAPWYVLATMQGSGDFVGRQLVFENILRFLGGEEITSAPIWFYIPTLFTDILPWSLLLLYFWIQEFRGRADASIRGIGASAQSRVRRLCHIWLGTGIVLFSLSSGKRDAYLLPLYPAVAIYLGWMCEMHWLSVSDRVRSQARKISQAIFVVLLLVAVLLFGAFQYTRLPFSFSSELAGQIFRYFQDVRESVVIWITAVAALALLVRYRARTPRGAEFALLVILPGFIALFVQLGLGIKNDLKGFHFAAADMNERLPRDVRLQAVRLRREEYLDPLLNYLARGVTLIEPPLHIESCAGHYVLQKKYFEDLSKEAMAQGARVRILARYRQIPDEIKGRSDRDIILFECPARQ